MSQEEETTQRRNNGKSFDPFKHRQLNGETPFIPGTNYVFEGRVVELKILDGEECLVWDPVEAREVECRIGELTLPRPQPVAGLRRPAHLSRGQAKNAARLRSAMTLYFSLPKGQRTAAKLDEIAQAFRLTGRSLRRRFANWNGRLNSLLPGSRGPRPDSKRLNIKVENIISWAIKARTESGEAWGITELVDDIQVACKAVNPPLDPPCERTVEDRLRRKGYSLKRHRSHGHKKANEKENPHLGTYDAGLPLSQIEIDHTRVDLMVWDSVERVGLRRPWLTLVIDCASRVVLGFYLSFDAPNSESVACALLMAMLPKHQLLKELGLGDLKWDVWGRPKSLQTDWAQEFRSKAFRMVCENAGIRAKLRSLGQKHWGGRIERLIGSFMGKVHMLPGTTFSNPKARDGYDAEHKATMDLSELRSWLVAEIVNYNNSGHRGINKRTPYQMWKHLLTTAEGAYIPPPFVDDGFFKQFEYDVLPPKRVKVHGRHVVWNNRPYENGVFSLFKVGSYAEIRYRPTKLSHVLFRDKLGIVHEVATTQPPKRAISLSEERAVRGAITLQAAADPDADKQRKSSREHKNRVTAESKANTLAARTGRRSKLPDANRPVTDGLCDGEFIIPRNVIWN